MTTVTQAIAQRDQERPANGTPSASLAIQPGQDFWTGKQMAALAVLGLKNVSTADLAVFMHYCQKTQLDPFSRQIYGIMRREQQGDQWVDKFTIQVGIDGFRVIRDGMPLQPATPRRVRAVVQAPGPAADIVHHAEGAPAPADPGPAAPDETPGSGPAAGPGPARPSKAATDKLPRLLQQIPLGDGANEVALIEWLTGHPIDTDLTKADVATVTI